MKKFLKQISNIQYGEIEIITPDKKKYKFFGNTKEPKAQIEIKSHKSINKILSGGSLGFAESYLDGHIRTKNLKTLMTFFVKNEKYLSFIFRKNIFIKILTFIRKKLTENTIYQNKKNISYHYDLGNDFFKYWLDKNLTYSSGIYNGEKNDLETAQINKLEKICKLLKLKPNHHILEIGCGWGSFAVYVAKKYKCKVTCITLSKRQLLYVKNKVKNLNLSKKINVKLIDYRNLEGKFDRIASIEMFEAVGEKYWDVYFKKIKQLLKPNGFAAFQIITIQNKRFLNYKRNNLDFIQKYIFPGGMLPSKEILQKIILRNGLLQTSMKDFGKDYSKTLREWFVRFRNSWKAIKHLGFDERFKRMWEYYLNYCETGFEQGTLNVVQIGIKNKE
tara:strand:+ start:2278 stop:3444 length:1167 start_codon:yes stop_codon:yes gene_type:complete